MNKCFIKSLLFIIFLQKMDREQNIGSLIEVLNAFGNAKSNDDYDLATEALLEFSKTPTSYKYFYEIITGPIHEVPLKQMACSCLGLLT